MVTTVQDHGYDCTRPWLRLYKTMVTTVQDHGYDCMGPWLRLGEVVEGRALKGSHWWDTLPFDDLKAFLQIT